MSSLKKVLSNPFLIRILANKQMEKLEKCVNKTLNVNLKLTSQKKPEKSIKLNVNQETFIGREEQLPFNGKYFAFQGIPYAEAPLGQNRFKPPIPIQSFKNRTLDCTKEGDFCVQPDLFTKEIVGSETCLFLNVYTPCVDKGSKLPVMVYIHGGGFVWGNGNTSENSPEYLVQEGVIVVTFNYRLNVLGFLHFPSGGIHGNQGLRDQRLALRWIKENIEKFGGDSNNITLFGHSAGGAAVHLHMMLPESKQYFHKGIIMSGFATMDWFRQFNPEDNARRLAKVMGCQSQRDSEIADFLRNSNAKTMSTKFMDVLTPMRKKRGLPIIFTTALDNGSPDPMLPETIDVKLSTPGTIDMPVMMGVTEHDGMVMVPPQLKRSDLWNKEPGRFIPRTVDVDGDTDNETCRQLGDQIKHFYLNDKAVSENVFPEFMDFMTEYNFNIALQSAAEFHSRFQHATTDLYYYQFSYDGDLNMMKKLLGFNLEGANHGDDLTYLFVMKMAEVLVTPDSEAGIMRRKMCRMWTNFAKYSNPTPMPGKCDLLGDLKWDPIKKHDNPDVPFTLDCLDINTQSKMIRDPCKKRIDFWRGIYQKYNQGFLKPKL